MENDDGDIQHGQGPVEVDVNPAQGFTDVRQWIGDDLFFAISAIFVFISGFGISATIVHKADMEDLWVIWFYLILFTITGTIGSCMCFLYGWNFLTGWTRKRTTVGSADVAGAIVMQVRSVSVSSREVAARQLRSGVPRPSQAHVMDPSVPGPSGLQRPDADAAHVMDPSVPGPSGLQRPDTDASRERSRSHSGSNAETSESESPPRGERQIVPEASAARSTAASRNSQAVEASAARSTAASRMSRAAASVAQIAEESLRRAVTITIRNEPGGDRQASVGASSGSGRGTGRQSRSMRQRKSIPDLRALSCDRQDGGDQ